MGIRASYKWRSNSPGDGLSRRGFLGVALFDLSLLEDEATHNELFFVHDRSGSPNISTHDWKLNAPGAPLTYEQLSELPTRALDATLECAGNPPGGGLVSHAVWEGVPLKDILNRAAPRAFVRLAARDGFTRVLPFEKAMHPDTLLALRMNGESLPPAHGGPVRLLVPGWYGMDSVKWLDSIELTDTPDESKEYRRRTQSLLGAATGDPVRGVLIKSVFSRPIDGAVLATRRFTLRGAAWAGEGRVAKVEVSTDDGSTWVPARLGEAKPWSWVFWQCDWRIPRAGEHRLAVRATGDRGDAQPAARDPRRADAYEQNAWQRIAVTAI